jgi:hypothetical protein
MFDCDGLWGDRMWKYILLFFVKEEGRWKKEDGRRKIDSLVKEVRYG